MQNEYPIIGGFYYHYKHDQSGPINVMAYEIMGFGFSTESGGVHGDKPEDFLDDEVVIYRPLYDTALVYKAGKRFWTRPRAMFMEEVTKDGKTFPRFQLITDEQVIAELKKIRDELY